MRKKNKGYDTVIHLPFKYILVNYHPLIKIKTTGVSKYTIKRAPQTVKRIGGKKSHIQEVVKACLAL